MRTLVLLGPALLALASAQDPVAKTQTKVVYAGRCLDLERNPIGSKATLSLYKRDYERHRLDLLHKTRSNREGKFEFPAVDRIPDEEVGWRHYFIVAEAAEYATGFASVRGANIPLDKLEVILLPAGTVKGTVTGGNGKPVAGARVGLMGYNMQYNRQETFEPGYNTFFASKPLARMTAQTDEQGRFELRSLPVGYGVLLSVSHPEFAFQRVDGKAPAEINITLVPGGIVTGRVVFEGGKPAAGVIVQAQGARASSGWAETRTDAEGRYQLESLIAGAYNIWADTDEWTIKAHDSFAVGEGQKKAAPDLVFIRGGFIKGRVVDQDGKPFQPGKGSDVGLYGPARPRSGAAIIATRIAADGTFKIRAAPGNNYVYLRPGAKFPNARAAKNVVVESGKTLEVEFAVQR